MCVYVCHVCVCVCGRAGVHVMRARLFRVCLSYLRVFYFLHLGKGCVLFVCACCVLCVCVCVLDCVVCWIGCLFVCVVCVCHIVYVCICVRVLCVYVCVRT